MATESAFVQALKDALVAELQRRFPTEAAVLTIGADVATILAKAAGMAMEVGPLDPQVWLVSLEEGAREFGSEELAKQWLSASSAIINRNRGP